MKAIIPMAGYGTRLRPHTFSRPKPLINVAGQPMLKHLLKTLEPLDIDEYIFIVGYLGDQIEAFITENYDFNARFVVQEEMIGQAHAIYLAKEYLDGPAIVLFSDTLFETDLNIINTTEADAVVFVKEVEDPRRFGVVKLNDEGYITEYVEKPDSMENKQAVIGLYYLRDSAHMIRAIETQMDRNQMTKGEFFIADAYQIMIDEGAKFAIQNVDVWLDCGKRDTVLETNRHLLDHGFDNSASVNQPGVTVISPSYVDPSAELSACVIGPHATISAGCKIDNSIIRDTVVDRGAQVSGLLLEQSLIGQNAEVTGQFDRLDMGDNSAAGYD